MKTYWVWIFIGVCIPLIIVFTPPMPMPRIDKQSPFPDPILPDYSIKIMQESDDTIQNPYAPPLRRYQSIGYKQMGYLKRGSRRIPFFGKQADAKRDKYYYYTMMDSIKLPVMINRRKCSVSPGCDSAYTGDLVNVDGSDWDLELYDTGMY